MVEGFGWTLGLHSDSEGFPKIDTFYNERVDLIKQVNGIIAPHALRLCIP